MKRYCVTSPKGNMRVFNTDMVMVLSAFVPEEIVMKRQRQAFDTNRKRTIHEGQVKVVPKSMN